MDNRRDVVTQRTNVIRLRRSLAKSIQNHPQTGAEEVGYLLPNRLNSSVVNVKMCTWDWPQRCHLHGLLPLLFSRHLRK